jgi:glycosyltransferase involved in cell wall biosynthesis
MINSQQYDITVVLNVHREGQLVHPTLRSIWEAKEVATAAGITVDFVIVADKSDSETLDYLAESSYSKGARLEIVKFGDLGISRNHGQSVSNSKYITYLDADDLWGDQWLIGCYNKAQKVSGDFVFHPEFNVIFGSDNHVLIHRGMDDVEYVPNYLNHSNYWTALSFSTKDIYSKYPYNCNDIKNGFGFEDWSWNTTTVSKGIAHLVVEDTVHFIRRKESGSLLEATNDLNCLMTPVNL